MSSTRMLANATLLLLTEENKILACMRLNRVLQPPGGPESKHNTSRYRPPPYCDSPPCDSAGGGRKTRFAPLPISWRGATNPIRPPEDFQVGGENLGSPPSRFRRGWRKIQFAPLPRVAKNTIRPPLLKQVRGEFSDHSPP